MGIKQAEIEFIHDILNGSGIQHKVTRMEDLKGIFGDEAAWKRLIPQSIIYEVDAYKPVTDGTLGGLFFGVTRIQPGQVGNEYFMTRGHFHALGDRAEFYWGISGEGMLILMDKKRKVYAEKMRPGSLHYIPAHTAHRVSNTGKNVLSFGACWPADAGYDYDEIKKNGFAARLINADGIPQLKPVK
jgi:glucose-6-phosphate isomerase